MIGVRLHALGHLFAGTGNVLVWEKDRYGDVGLVFVPPTKTRKRWKVFSGINPMKQAKIFRCNDPLMDRDAALRAAELLSDMFHRTCEVFEFTPPKPTQFIATH